MPSSPLHEPVLAWYDAHARDLPWRAPDRTAWGVLVSEVMLQQTPVARVEPAWRAWMARWPSPAALAAAEPAEAIRQWDRLGYPRRALRLHAAASVIVDRHGGRVPTSPHELRTLPGIGDYTAAAVAAFAYGQRHAVLDTNVRRVLARVLGGRAMPAAATTATEVRAAERVVPDESDSAATWAVAVMELGALVCTARAPRCGACPVSALCTWRATGSPPYDGPARRGQSWAGTDRQCRGRLMAALRDAAGPITRDRVAGAWPTDARQRERALDGLVADGLVERLAGDRYRLPVTRSSAST